MVRSNPALRDLTRLPADLPVPSDDGAADHLRGMALPARRLQSTRGALVDLVGATADRAVLFFYPRSGVPSEPPPDGWDLIPGARGCTPQSCGYRDLHAEFQALGCRIFGISTQTPAFQREFATRVHLPFELLSDERLELTRALRLPTMEFPVRSGGPKTLTKRLSLYVEAGRIERVWYPVFPPDRNAANVIQWLQARTTNSK